MAETRTDPEAAYRAFMAMPQSEWLALTGSLLEGGALTPAENEGFERAMRERSRPSPGRSRYRFFVELTGAGATEEEAWAHAVDSFSDDPGEPSRTELDFDQDDLDG